MAEPSGLTIRQVAELTGVSAGTLRKWEQRYGFPQPLRSATGRLSYSDGDVSRIQSVLDARRSGLSLPSAIQRSASPQVAPEPSVFSLLYRRHALRPFRTSSSMLLRITRAIEDEVLARAERGVLVGGFQSERHYRASRARWQRLAEVSAVTLVRSDFEVAGHDERIALVPVDAESGGAREWSLVYGAARRGACVAAWEVPDTGQGRAREFETVWTTEPWLVYEACKHALELATREMPGLQDSVARHMGTPPPPSSHEVRSMAELSARIVGYMAAPGENAD